MNVSECMTKGVQLCSPDDTVQDAARLMRDADVGILPVGEDDRLVGMISDRDIVIRAVANGQGAATLVRQVMSREILYCFADEDVDDVIAKFASQQIRRLPVLNRAKRMVGIISIADVSKVDSLGEISSAGALAAVSQPGGLHNPH